MTNNKAQKYTTRHYFVVEDERGRPIEALSQDFKFVKEDVPIWIYKLSRIATSFKRRDGIVRATIHGSNSASGITERLVIHTVDVQNYLGQVLETLLDAGIPSQTLCDRYEESLSPRMRQSEQAMARARFSDALNGAEARRLRREANDDEA